jgi:hypothetical protein
LRSIVRELFIYYRTTFENASVLHATVSRLQDDLRARHPGLQARLMRRPDAADGLHTWMETYADPHNKNGITDALQREIDAAALVLAPLLVGPRHVESFVTCA